MQQFAMVSADHRNRSSFNYTEGECINKKWDNFPCKTMQVGVVPADVLGCLQIKLFSGIY
jgi:hypothetical protein